jgi:hypothetical protein
MRLGIFTLAGIISALSAGHTAYAGDAACVWKGIPQANRDAFVAAFPIEGQSALSKLNTPVEVLAPVMSRCGVKTSDQNKAAVAAVVAYAFDEGLARLLKDKFGQGREQIDGAWNALPASRREAFANSVLSGADGGAPASSHDPALRETAISVVKQIATKLGVTDPRAMSQIGLYLTWKVARPFYEAKF